MALYDFDLYHVPPPPLRKDYKIGVIGTGFIVRDIQLVAYRSAGYQVAGIASRSYEAAREVADQRELPRAYESIQELLADPAIEVIDIAIPPDQQIEIVRQAAKQAKHIKGILCQKPLAVTYSEACEIVEIC